MINHFGVFPIMSPANINLFLHAFGFFDSAFRIPTSSFAYTGIGAITWEDTNIQATRAALSMAPR